MLGGLTILKTYATSAVSTALPMLLSNTTTAKGEAEAKAAFNAMASPITGLLNAALTPLISVVGAAGALYCVLLGAKYAKAEEPQDREKAKKSLQNAIVGFLLIFVLLAALKVGMGPMQTWYSKL